MEIHQLVQGTPEWHAHRASHFNASDTPAMLGLSPYTTRTKLLRQFATGIAPEVDAHTQDRFDKGHHYEALARPLAEKIIGQPLYPVVGSQDQFSASFDGLTACGSIAFEHKTLNQDIVEAIEEGTPLPEMYRAQMEHQIMVSGAERVLFMATQWDDADNLQAGMHCWYQPDPEMRQRVISGWGQFAVDLEQYHHNEKQAEAVGRAPDALPAIRIEVTGMVTASNLAEFKETALAVFRGINTNLQTDQDFADAEKSVKFCKDAEDRLDAAKQHALSQTESIDELFRTIDSIKEEARTVRLKLEKLVKAEKENRKIEIITNTRQAIEQHIDKLNERIGGRWMPLANAQQFADAIKGLKSIDSMRDKVATALANAKIEANEIADRIEANRKTVDDMTLFHDFASVCTKSADDFAALLAMRLNQRNEAEEKRLEQERERIRKEEAEKLVAQEKQAQPAPLTKCDGNHAESVPCSDEECWIHPATAASPQVDKAAAVVEHQEEISAFLNSLDVDDKKKQSIRPYLVAFVQFQVGRTIKKAA